MQDPSDDVSRRIAGILLSPSPTRNRLTDGVFLSNETSDQLGRLEDALPKVIDAEPLRRRLKKEGHAQPPRCEHGTWIRRLVQDALITEQERMILGSAHFAASKVIAVDDFEPAMTGKRASPEAVA